MSTIEKKCVICAKSCAGQPRIKDAQGNYAHKTCAQEQQAKSAKSKRTPAAAAVAPVLDLGPEEEPDMAAFLDDLPSVSDQDPSAGIRAACPGCGTSIASDATICMSCGCNTKTGRGPKIKTPKIKSKKQGPNLAAKAGSLAIAPFLPIIGAVIGGAIGAAAWAAIAYFTGFEIGILATVVGAICGIGAVIGAGGEGNAWSGMVAVVAALVSIVAGKAIVYEIYLDQLNSIKVALQAEAETEKMLGDYLDYNATYDIAFDIAWEQQENGDTLEWPNPEIDLFETMDLSDFPQDIIDETNEKWNSMDLDERVEFRQAKVDEANEANQVFTDYIDEEIDAGSNLFDNLDLFDALWAFLALGAAWSIGNGSND